MKVTVPPGLLFFALDVTVAVNVTDCPKTDGSAQEVSVVLVAVPAAVTLRLPAT